MFGKKRVAKLFSKTGKDKKMTLISPETFKIGVEVRGEKCNLSTAEMTTHCTHSSL